VVEFYYRLIRNADYLVTSVAAAPVEGSGDSDLLSGIEVIFSGPTLIKIN
jgi:hypothetical protein